MTQTKDYLARIMAACQGEIFLSINQNRGGYETIEEYLESRKTESVLGLDPDRKKRMIEADCIVEAGAYPNSTNTWIGVVAENVEIALKELAEACEEKTANWVANQGSNDFWERFKKDKAEYNADK